MGQTVEGVRDVMELWSAVGRRVIELLDRAEAQGYVEVEAFGFKMKLHLPPKVSR